MKTLVLVEHDNSSVKDATLAVVTAASKLGEVHLLVAGAGCASVADEAAKISGVGKVHLADDAAYEHQLAEKFLTENIANFPVIFDPQGQVAEAFKLKGMPSSFVIDRAGKIKYSHVGFFTNKQKSYELELTRLLNEK